MSCRVFQFWTSPRLLKASDATQSFKNTLDLAQHVESWGL